MGMLIPSMKGEFWHWKGFKIWLVSMPAPLLTACLIGDNYWPMPGQWDTTL